MFLFGKFSSYTHISFGYYAFIGHKYLPSPGSVAISRYDEIVKVLQHFHYIIKDANQAINNWRKKILTTTMKKEKRKVVECDWKMGLMHTQGKFI